MEIAWVCVCLCVCACVCVCFSQSVFWKPALYVWPGGIWLKIVWDIKPTLNCVIGLQKSTLSHVVYATHFIAEKYAKLGSKISQPHSAHGNLPWLWYLRVSPERWCKIWSEMQTCNQKMECGRFQFSGLNSDIALRRPNYNNSSTQIGIRKRSEKLNWTVGTAILFLTLEAGDENASWLMWACDDFFRPCNVATHTHIHGKNE